MERPWDLDDKDLIILAVFLLCAGCVVLYPPDTGAALIEKAFYGLFGMAVGKATTNGNA